MITFDYTIVDPEGLHSRSVVSIVSVARLWKSSVTVELDGKKASGTDSLELVDLDARYSDSITVTVDGPDEELAAEALREALA